MTIELPPPDPRIASLLAPFPAHLFGERFYYSWELVDGYGGELVLDIARELDVVEPLSTGASARELLGRRGFQESFLPALDWLLRTLERRHLVAPAGADAAGETRYRLTVGRLPDSRAEELRRQALEIDPANAPALELLALAAAAYPAVAAGRTRGQEALFGLGQTRLWLEYFSNDNPTYAVNNFMAAYLAAERLPPGPVRILELGGGTGGASRALAEELARRGRLGDVESYLFTEPSPFFRRRAERELRAAHPEVPWSVGALDVDLPFAEQGVGGGLHLVYGGNVLHVARDLDAALAEVRRCLLPGGWLVGSESIRPVPGQPLSTELVFQILEDFWDVELDRERRPTPGFLTPGQWRRLLADSGFEEVGVLPDHDSIHRVYPRFYVGVVCGRRPVDG